MKVIPKGTFILRVDTVDGKPKDVLARKGILMEVSEDEYNRFSNRFIKYESKAEPVNTEPEKVIKVEPKKEEPKKEEIKKVVHKKKTIKSKK